MYTNLIPLFFRFFLPVDLHGVFKLGTAYTSSSLEQKTISVICYYLVVKHNAGRMLVYAVISVILGWFRAVLQCNEYIPRFNVKVNGCSY